MSMGHVQQVGTPLELYDQPANPFVAGFIGLPPMNTWKARVRDGFLEGAGFTCPLTEKERGVLSSYGGKEIILGVRPEDIQLGNDVTVLVSNNENLGMNTLVYGKMGKNTKITAKFRD
jgi:multiple sugar transport system ATP-binding protein